MHQPRCGCYEKFMQKFKNKIAHPLQLAGLAAVSFFFFFVTANYPQSTSPTFFYNTSWSGKSPPEISRNVSADFKQLAKIHDKIVFRAPIPTRSF